ncbi:hypothetical protein C8A00DRAFT_15764 [Chaetomidium leptoderma]|uniref:Uncharacterized protein n=1 Tax=Chaetomidium leptoderma TaxID=669021 RepID=A0AAN6VK22_9PEZI|nr:hypothetical protein C8A00DRAFT_15764 [Chaetomidium leptoderma]
MRGKRLVRRLRAFFSRKKAAIKKNLGAKKDAGGSESGAAGPVIAHRPQDALPPPGDNTGHVTTIAEMWATADPQVLSRFLSDMPLEIRRKIYVQVWRDYLKPRPEDMTCGGSKTSWASGADMRMHIYTPTSANTGMAHARCILCPGAPSQVDPWVKSPWPFEKDGENEASKPPVWFWEAWVLRINWGKHWACQRALQRRWVPHASTSESSSSSSMPVERAPFMPLFLACKKMYLESVHSLFESFTPIFTNSLDVHKFFIQKPHPFIAHLRNLELSLTHHNDHLYMTKKQHDEPPVPRARATTTTAAGTSNDASSSLLLTTVTAHANNTGTTTTTPPTNSSSRVCFLAHCGIDLFRSKLWKELVHGIRSAAPGLRNTDVHLGGYIRAVDRARFLAPFGVAATVADLEAGADDDDDDDDDGELEEDEVWRLPGMLAVMFSNGSMPGDGTGYVQVGRKMVVLEV